MQNKEIPDAFSKSLWEGKTSASDACVFAPTFPHFDRRNQRWTDYLARLENYFAAYNVKENSRKKSYLLAWVGQEVMDLYLNLFSENE